MSTPKVKTAHVVPEKDGLFSVEIEFEDGRAVAFVVGDRAVAEEQARRALEVPEFAATIWSGAKR